jgi:hypothetical protein
MAPSRVLSTCLLVLSIVLLCSPMVHPDAPAGRESRDPTQARPATGGVTATRRIHARDTDAARHGKQVVHASQPEDPGLGSSPREAAGGVVLDRFGGVTSFPAAARATGLFRVEKIGARWVFVTPLGNPFWMLGVFNVSLEGTEERGGAYNDRVVGKYGSAETWGEQTARRLKGWGFNTAAEYADWRVWKRIPTVHILNTAVYCLTNRWNAGPGPVKELISGTNPQVYTGWRGGTTPDVFDPNFAGYVDGYLTRDMPGLKPMYGSPYLIGIATDDRDYLFGFGPGTELRASSPHVHLGWIVLVGQFQQTANAGLGVTYTDPKVYAKYALRDLLQTKYGTIAALNAAWGSSYTSWDSAGGWGSGTGLLDENGRHGWMGHDVYGLIDVRPALRADLDSYLYVHAKRYFSVMTAAIRKHAGAKHLVFGPATLNSDGLTRRQILQAAGEEVDVVQATIESQAALDLTARYAPDRPIVTWEGFTANPDSGLWRRPQPTASWTAADQLARGQLYAKALVARFEATAANGTLPIAGIKYWEFHDNSREKLNWGLVTLSDNAYDGREARIGRGTDTWGYPTGGEERDYGDFLSEVSRANLRIPQMLMAEPGGSGPARVEAGRLCPRRTYRRDGHVNAC